MHTLQWPLWSMTHYFYIYFTFLKIFFKTLLHNFRRCVFSQGKKQSLWIKCEEEKVGRDSLQHFWVNPEVTDSFLSHSVFICFFNCRRLIYLLPESSFCLCSFSLWLCSHFVCLETALWQIHDLRFHTRKVQNIYKSHTLVLESNVCLQRVKKSHVLSLSLSFLPLSLLISHPHEMLTFLLICLFLIAHWMQQSDRHAQKVASIQAGCNYNH